MSEHTPTLEHQSRLWWVMCSCRWVSAVYLDSIKARAAWATHEATVEQPAGPNWRGETA